MIRSLKLAKYGLLVLDVCAFILSYHIGYFLRYFDFYQELLVPGVLWFLPFLILTFIVLDAYNPWSHHSRLSLATRMLPALIVLTVTLSLVAFLVFGEELQGYSGRGVLYFSLAVFGVYSVVSRLLFAYLFDQTKLQSHWLILTESRYVPLIDHEVSQRFPYWQISYLVRDYTKSKADNDGPSVYSIKSHLNKMLTQKWDGVVIATESLTNSEMSLFLGRRLRGLRVIDLVSFYERFFLKLPLFFVEHSQFMIGRGFFVLSNPVGLRVKSMMDYSISAVLLLLSLPLFILISVLIWLDSGRPIFFRQQRTGKEGSRFEVFKFRTMVVGADKLDPYTQKKDSRITRIGHFLRLTRLDELPQLFNILAGQMSLIGPRAEWTKLTDEYEKKIPFYNLRHLVRPGLTGWAQVMYPYGANIQDTIEKLEYDLYYIKNYTALLDINILFKTVRVVIFGGGR